MATYKHNIKKLKKKLKSFTCSNILKIRGINKTDAFIF